MQKGQANRENENSSQNANATSSSRRSWHFPRGRNRRRGPASGSKPPEIIVAKGPVSTIVVAAGPLEYGTTLTDENVSEAPWELSIVPDGAFQSKADLLKDGARAALTSMKRNEPILSSRITGANQPASLAALTEPGMRAVSVRVDEARGVAGFVRMGDRVDFILIRGGSKNEPSMPTPTSCCRTSRFSRRARSPTTAKNTRPWFRP